MKNVVFYLCIGCLFTHELDAMPNHEWRGLPLLQTLPDETGMLAFVALHVPLFAVLVALIASTDRRVRRSSRLVIAAFVVVHGVLHALSSGHATYEFSSMLSRLLIFGGAACGGLYVLLETRRS